MSYLALLGMLWACGVLALAYRCRRELAVAWSEPTLRDPVLIIESDDWGPGPDEDAAWLSRIAEVLSRYRDRRARHPVMTIGVVLALPELTPRETPPASARVTLAADRFRAVRECLLAGADAGVLSLQLHGMEHCWGPALRLAATRDPAVARVLEREGVLRTEALPSHLQTRWADTSTLPSVPLPLGLVSNAVREELLEFTEVFGREATVAVPPTFVWDERMEREWARGGIRYIVTPGRRYVGRDQTGRLICDKEPIYNGQRGASGVVYLVRNRYFEPSLGHDAIGALRALAEKTRAGRPTLLEMHRFNFTGDTAAATQAVSELDRLLAFALKRYPELCFVSTEELGARISARDPDLIETRPVRRIAAWLARLAESSRLKKFAWFTGLAVPAWIFLLLTRSPDRGSHASSGGERLAT